MSDIAPGLTGERSLIVEEAHTARQLGSGGLSVYATPMMVLHMEEAAHSAVAPLLPPGSSTVGASLEIRHLAPSAVGARVTARAELVKVDGRMLTFRVEAFDEAGKIGEGTHLRAVIDIERFTAKLRARSAAR